MVTRATAIYTIVNLLKNSDVFLFLFYMCKEMIKKLCEN